MKKVLTIIAIVVIVALFSIRVITGRQGVSEASVAKAALLGISVRDITDEEDSRLRKDSRPKTGKRYVQS